jgi:hypothetical protein
VLALSPAATRAKPRRGSFFCGGPFHGPNGGVADSIDEAKAVFRGGGRADDRKRQLRKSNPPWVRAGSFPIGHRGSGGCADRTTDTAEYDMVACDSKRAH